MRLLRRVVRRQVDKMSGRGCSLENLFGLDRHRFPKKLPTVRTGRGIEYTLVAVVQCMIALLADEKRPWLPDLKIRNTILRGIIERAQEKSGKLASILQAMFQRFLS